MKVNDLAESFLDIKTKRDEKRRIIGYVHAKKLKELEQVAIDVDSKLRVLSFKNDINNDEELYNQYNLELKDVEDELKSLLAELNANQLDPLRTHVKGKIYFDVWLDEEGNVQSAGPYHKMS